MTIEVLDNLRYVDPQYPKFRWQMRNDHILGLFDLPGNGPIPVNHSDVRQIGNVTVMILPRGVGAKMGIKRRVVAKCPQCAKLVCAGHLDQHMKIHKPKKESHID